MGDKNCYKIGASSNPNQRLKTLQTANPELLSHYVLIACKDHFGMESYFHDLFSFDKNRGEWFHISKQEIDNNLHFLTVGHLKYKLLKYKPSKLYKNGTLIFDWDRDFEDENIEGWILG